MKPLKIEVPGGRYLVAVSGGVDSVVLLDLLRMYPGAKITVAHFDHGIRPESKNDRLFVEQLARRYHLPFVFQAAALGPDASEALARKSRYSFLRKAQAAAQAEAIVTAHHQDDVLETAIINLLRGTGRKGLSSLTSGEGIVRPLLDVPKSELIDYARRHRLQWTEDSTNNDTHYLRNHIRHVMLPKWSAEDKQQMVDIARKMHHVNHRIDDIIDGTIAPQLDRQWFVLLPHAVACEVMASWLRLHNLREFDRPTIERLVVGAKVSEAGKTIDALNGYRMLVSKNSLALMG